MDKHLHIVSFDVPFPADYGGVIDVFYKIVALHNAGIKIHLHCFTKGRKPQPELKQYCESVNYYQRSTGISGWSFFLPYIVSSRSDQSLLENLQKDQHPILFEGIHTTYWLHQNKFPGRQIFIRLHNVEQKYYTQLQKNERNFFKRFYFRSEAAALKKYEASIASKAHLLPMSEEDDHFFKEEFNAERSTLLPVFTPWNEVTSTPETYDFCLYHGNLSVNENENAARWLAQEIFNKANAPLIVAGRSPSKELIDIVRQLPNATIHPDPSDEQMRDYIHHAFVHVLPSFNTTGVKLKLLNALFNGRHCLVNSWAVNGSGLEELCVIADDETSFISKLESLMNTAFTQEDIEKRKAVLFEKYSNQKNIQLFTSLIL